MVWAFDPAVRELPPSLGSVRLAPDLGTALMDADAAVVCTEWPEFRAADWPELVRRMSGKIVVDANRFLEKPLQAAPGVEHISVGKA